MTIVFASTVARSPLRRSIALGVSLALALPVGLAISPTTAQAAWAGPASPAPADAEDLALEDARKLYEEGKARFDTFDYEGAVEQWTKAYATLPSDAASIRNRLVYNIATAQEKAFELDNDVQHLRQALMLLESYIENYKAIYERTPETKAEVDKAEERIATIKERIEQAERGEVRPPPPVDGESGDTVIGWNNEAAPPPNPELLAKNRRLAAEERKTDRMLIASYVTLSVGGLFTLAGFFTVIGANAVEEQPAQTPEGEVIEGDNSATETARGGGYGGLALGLAGLVTGFTLLGVGLDRRKKARKGTLVSATPVLGPGFGGASLRVRF